MLGVGKTAEKMAMQLADTLVDSKEVQQVALMVQYSAFQTAVSRVAMMAERLELLWAFVIKISKM